jgi:hypothetical protein
VKEGRRELEGWETGYIVALGRLEERTVPTIGSNPLTKIIICMTSIDFYIFHHQLAFF